MMEVSQITHQRSTIKGQINLRDDGEYQSSYSRVLSFLFGKFWPLVILLFIFLSFRGRLGFG